MEEVKFSDILKRGLPVKTQTQDSRDWIANAIVNYYENSEEIELMYDNRYNGDIVLVGDAMKITYTEGSFEYIIDAWITGIKLEPSKLITLKLVSIKKIENLRKDERFSVNYGAMIYSIIDEEGSFGVITNISASGLGFVIRKFYQVGEIVRISIILPSSSFSVEGEIVRSVETSKGTEYGVKFTELDAESVAIAELLADIKEREERLSRIVGFIR
ncbi:MAG: PilZ domain-containing protein [Clostridia bacterium]|nr:PilZ domain-containing protein [Clostridia bacterium]